MLRVWSNVSSGGVGHGVGVGSLLVGVIDLHILNFKFIVHVISEHIVCGLFLWPDIVSTSVVSASICFDALFAFCD